VDLCIQIILTLEELIQYNDYAIGWTTRKQKFNSQKQQGFFSSPYHPTSSGDHPAFFPTGTSVPSLKLTIQAISIKNMKSPVEEQNTMALAI
jgi:hypothetical protein